jgi:hypothetical protein
LLACSRLPPQRDSRAPSPKWSRFNPAQAINGIEIIHQWYYRPDSMAIVSNCAFTKMGVWSENRLDRSVVVAVYGQPT